MKRFIGPATFLVIAALVSHFAIVYSAPGLIMDRAMTMIAERGVDYSNGGSRLHSFNLAPRMTPETQSVVRPSPDLAYSACVFDLDELGGDLQVKMAGYEGYSSLSFFDANTNNFTTIRGDGSGVEVLLTTHGSSNSGPNTIETPSSKGVILIRRLAPTQAEYDRVAEIAEADLCGSSGA